MAVLCLNVWCTLKRFQPRPIEIRGFVFVDKRVPLMLLSPMFSRQPPRENDKLKIRQRYDKLRPSKNVSFLYCSSSPYRPIQCIYVFYYKISLRIELGSWQRNSSETNTPRYILCNCMCIFYPWLLRGSYCMHDPTDEILIAFHLLYVMLAFIKKKNKKCNLRVKLQQLFHRQPLS